MLHNKRVVVVTPVEKANRERFQTIAPDFSFTFITEENFPISQKFSVDIDKFHDDFIAANVVFGQPPVELLPKMTSLEWINLAMAGTEPYSKDGVLRNDVALTCSSGAYGQAISEHMLACTLMLYKKLHLYRDNMHNSLWSDRGEVRSISGKRVLIVGLGDIGSRYAALLKPLGAHIVGIRRSGTSMPPFVDELYPITALDRLLPDADIVALTLPNTPETVGIMSKSRIFSMKNDAILLNIGRGNAVDTDAVCEALNSGKLSGAALDVTDPEPLPPDHPLWKSENALITPHISGFFHLRQTYDNIIDIMAENLRRYINQEPLEHIVDRSTGYQKTRQ